MVLLALKLSQVKIYNGIKKRDMNNKYISYCLPVLINRERPSFSGCLTEKGMNYLGIRKGIAIPALPRSSSGYSRALHDDILPTPEPSKWQDRCGFILLQLQFSQTSEKIFAGYEEWSKFFQLYNRIFLDVELNYTPQSCNLLVIGLYYFNS